MMRSLFSGVTGLRSHQTKMDVIGNNISNVNTLGYKKSVTNFADLYSQNMSIASGATGEIGGTNARQIGLGTQVNSIVIKHTPGAAQYTGNTLDVAIEGDGFFILRTNEGERYSRAGDLAVDASGSLVNQSGHKVQCFDSTYQQGSIGRGKAAYINNQKTKDISSFEYKDANGMISTNSGTYTFEMTPVYDTTDPTKIDSYTVEMYRNGVLIPGGDDVKILDGTTEVTGDISVAAGTKKTYSLDIPDFGEIEFTIDNTEDTTNAKAVTFTELVSQLTGVVNNGYITVSNNDGFISGNTRGNMEIDPDLYTNFAINERGQLIAQLKEDMEIDGVHFSENEQIVLGYLALATFSNNEGLEKVSTNLYRSSANSGDPQVGRPGEPGYGGLTPSSLEMSNVDLSEEMVGMITTQRGFQANSRIITTSDTMLEELINLKR